MAEYIDRQELLENLNKFAPEHYSVLVNTLITKQPAALRIMHMRIVLTAVQRWMERNK